jgi:hypothetical protein
MHRAAFPCGHGCSRMRDQQLIVDRLVSTVIGGQSIYLKWRKRHSIGWCVKSCEVLFRVRLRRLRSPRRARESPVRSNGVNRKLAARRFSCASILDIGDAPLRSKSGLFRDCSEAQGERSCCRIFWRFHATVRRSQPKRLQRCVIVATRCGRSCLQGSRGRQPVLNAPPTFPVRTLFT